MTQTEVFQVMGEIQCFIKEQTKNKTDCAYLEDDPFGAKDLPESLLKEFDGEVPPTTTIKELDTILAGHKLRGRNKFDDLEWIKSLPTEELKAQARCDLKARETARASNDHQSNARPSVVTKKEPNFDAIAYTQKR